MSHKQNLTNPLKCMHMTVRLADCPPSWNSNTLQKPDQGALVEII